MEENWRNALRAEEDFKTSEGREVSSRLDDRRPALRLKWCPRTIGNMRDDERGQRERDDRAYDSLDPIMPRMIVTVRFNSEQSQQVVRWKAWRYKYTYIV